MQVETISKTKNKGTDQTSHLTRLRKVEGQLRGISKMMEEGKYCIDILTQFKAARSAMKSLEFEVLHTHLNGCVKNAIQKGKKTDTTAMVDEIMILLKKVTK